MAANRRHQSKSTRREGRAFWLFATAVLIVAAPQVADTGPALGETTVGSDADLEWVGGYHEPFNFEQHFDYMMNNCGTNGAALPFNGLPRDTYINRATYHAALDMNADSDGTDAGDTVYSIADGTYFAETMGANSFGGMGRGLWITHEADDGTIFNAGYGHIEITLPADRNLNEPGRQINRGDAIGTIASGPAPHLHLTIDSDATRAQGGTFGCDGNWPSQFGFEDPVAFLIAHPIDGSPAPDADNDGVVDADDDCENTPSGRDVAVGADGCHSNSPAPDFDGDGFDDLVVGAPGENDGRGVVHVTYGGPDGLEAGGTAVVDTLSQLHIDGAARSAGDLFGSAIVAADFNKDGFDDIAVGAPGVDNGAGAVYILYSLGDDGFAVAAGVSPDNEYFSQSDLNPDQHEPGDRFGASLAAGRFQGDDRNVGLAIGVPGEDSGAGRVVVAYHRGNSHFTDAGVQAEALSQQDIRDIEHEPGDEFGFSLEVGRYQGRDSTEALAVGVPGEDADAGRVVVFYSLGTQGLEGAVGEVDPEALNQSKANVGASEPGDRFGSSLADGYFRSDSRAIGLAIGSPGEDSSAGRVHVFYSRGTDGFEEGGTGVVAARTFAQNNLNPAAHTAGDQFAASLAVGKFRGRTSSDALAVGVPGEAQGAGRVLVFYSLGINGLIDANGTDNEGISQADIGIDAHEPGDGFGSALAAGAFKSGAEALTVGVPGENNSAGRLITFFPRGTNGQDGLKNPTVSQEGLSQGNFATGNPPEIDDFYGFSFNGSHCISAYCTATPPSSLLCNGLAVTVDIAAGDLPTSGDDIILGTSGPDTILAGDGDDTVCAGDGDDAIFGADGNDTILGEAGNDILAGNAGNDVIDGGDGDDTIFAGSGDDNVTGGTGEDLLGGSSGVDTISGGEGNDRISGGSDNDGTINGDAGDDAVNGGGDNDTEVHGGDGNDTVSGNGGSDVIYGGDGNDEVRGGQGNDIVNGDAGDDFVAGNNGTDTCNGGTGTDTAAANCEAVTGVP